MEQIYQLRQRLETPVSSYKDSTYVNESYIYNANAKSLNANRNQDAASPIYSNTSIEQYRPNSQTSYTNAMTYGESLSHLRHSIARNTNNQGRNSLNYHVTLYLPIIFPSKNPLYRLWSSFLLLDQTYMNKLAYHKLVIQNVFREFINDKWLKTVKS